MFVSDQSHVQAFDAVFRSVFGASTPPDGAEPGEERPASERASAPRTSAPREERGAAASPSSHAGDDDSDGAGAETPRALASDEERLAEKRFDALEPDELARLYRLMARLDLATPLRRTRRYERGRHGQRIDMRRTLRASLRSGGDPIRIARRRRRTVRRRLVMLCDISGSMEP